MAGSPLRTYPALKRGVSNTLAAGIQRAEGARVETYWNAGQLIRDHLHLHEDRAKYGQELFNRLETDVGVGRRLLYRCAQFARCFPRRPIVSGRTQLTWGHYRAVLDIDSAKERRCLLSLARREHLTAEQLEIAIRALPDGSDTDLPTNGPTDPPTTKLLTPKRGTIGVFQYLPRGLPIPSEKPRPMVDLGFTNYIPIPNPRSRIPAARVTLSARNIIKPARASRRADLFTYRAETIRVIDGDTIWFAVRLRPNHILKEKIRLRGIDCPELSTSAGRAARRFVLSQLSSAISITLTTTKPDKYDRYLADIFLKKPSGADVFLNNDLLANGHAVIKTDYAPSDWFENGGTSSVSS